MPLDRDFKGFISGLLYPIQFERDPADGIDRVLEMVVDRRAMNGTPEEYAAAVDAALQSDEQLAKLIPQPHSEAVIRAFLTALRPHLPPAPSAGGASSRGED